jgi:hypothetical protein
MQVRSWYDPELPLAELRKNINPLATTEDFFLGWFSMCRTDEFPEQIFQVWNKEYLDELAKLCKTFQFKRVLEVGAGNGELSSCLRKRGVNIVATDNYTWDIKRYHPVIKLSYKQAIRKYHPDLVICSWMLPGEDWTPYFRKYGANYLLIGEGPGGCCATESAFDDQEGYLSLNNFKLDEYNICRTDYDGLRTNHSHTLLFLRATTIMEEK